MDKVERLMVCVSGSQEGIRINVFNKENLVMSYDEIERNGEYVLERKK